MSMKVKVITPFFRDIILLLLFLFIVVSCNNSNRSENNSTGDSSKGTTSDTTTTGINSTDTMNNATTGRTSTGVKRKGRVTVTIAPKKTNTATTIKADKEGYYNYTETAPAFNGGQTALENFINNNIEYPEEAISYNVEGTVYVQFAVDENGKITNVTTTGNNLGYGLEEEAIKAVSKMPNWTPGQVNGKNVKARYELPITFKLEE